MNAATILPTRHSRTLSSRIVLAAVLCNVLALACYEIPFFVHTTRTSVESFQNRNRAVAERLAANLGMPVWNFDRAFILDQIRLELDAGALDHIELHIISTREFLDQSTFGTVPPHEGRQAAWLYRFLGIAPVETIKLPITYSGRILGSLTVQFAFDELVEVFRQLVLRVALEVAIFTLLVALILYALMRRLLHRPLAGVLAALDGFRQGSFIPNLDESRADEMGLLARGINTTARDIGEYQRELAEHNSCLQSTVAERSSLLIESERRSAVQILVSGIAHEINTPLGTSYTLATYLESRIQTLRQSLGQKDLEPAELDDFLERGSESLKHLIGNIQRLTELMNAFKQLSVDQYMENVRLFDLKEHLTSTVSTMDPVLNSRGIAYFIEGPAPAPIRSLPGILSQVIAQLVLNTIQHAFPEDLPPHKSITINLVSTRDGWRILYTDNGAAVATEAIASLWEAFYVHNRQAGGIGLGLYIVRNLVEQKLGGQIRIVPEDTLGPRTRGLCFELLVPDLRSGETGGDSRPSSP